MARKCPTCGGELIQNPKNPAYLLCTNCNKNYKTPSNNGSSNSKKNLRKQRFASIAKQKSLQLQRFVQTVRKSKAAEY